MLTVVLESVDLPSGVTLEAVDWQVAEDRLFTNLVINDENNTEEIYIKEFDISLDPEKTYYVRARIRNSRGYEKYSKVRSFRPKDILDNKLRLDFPGIVNPPKITHTHNTEKFPLSSFTLNLSDYNHTGKSKLVGVIFVFEDVYGNCIYNSGIDYENLEYKTFRDVQLPTNTVMRLRAAYVSSSGDISDFSTITVITRKITDLPDEVITDLSRLTPDSPIRVDVSQHSDLTKVEWKLLDNDDNIVFEKETVLWYTIIPGDKLPENFTGKLKVRARTAYKTTQWFTKDVNVLAKPETVE